MTVNSRSLAALNESVYGRGTYDDSPHLKHDAIRNMLLALLADATMHVESRGLPLTLLDIGAGTGPFVGPALRSGCRVTATELAPTAARTLSERYGHDPSFRCVLDPDGSLREVGRHSIILYASVLHHIPDYQAAIESALQLLEPGGALLTFQDPLWYPTMNRAVRSAHLAAYMAWRAGQPGAARATRSRLRRVAKGLDDSQATDTVEYHVLRSGVNQHALCDNLRPRFGELTIHQYWSTPSRTLQRVGERLRLASEFALVGLDFLG